MSITGLSFPYTILLRGEVCAYRDVDKGVVDMCRQRTGFELVRYLNAKQRALYIRLIQQTTSSISCFQEITDEADRSRYLTDVG